MVMRSPITGNTVVQHGVVEQDIADVNVALHDSEERRVADSAGIHKLGLEQDFLAAETLVTDSDDVAISLLLVGTLWKRLKYNLADGTDDPNSLLQDRAVWFDRHGAGQKLILVRHLHIAHVRELLWRTSQQSQRAAKRRSHQATVRSGWSAARN